MLNLQNPEDHLQLLNLKQNNSSPALQVSGHHMSFLEQKSEHAQIEVNQAAGVVPAYLRGRNGANVLGWWCCHPLRVLL